MTLKSIAVVFGLIFSVSIANAAETKAKRDPAQMPSGAVGLPIPKGGSGMPGPVGLPMPRDMACKRAAGMAAVSEALENADNTQSCAVDSVITNTEFKSYTINVRCSDNDERTEDTMDNFAVKTRIKNKKTRTCKVLSVLQDKE